MLQGGHALGPDGQLLSLRPELGAGPLDFSDLLRAVDAVEGLERIRFMSLIPAICRDTVIQAMAESEKVCRHISFARPVRLVPPPGAMNRLYTRAEYLSIVGKLRAAMPGLKKSPPISLSAFQAKARRISSRL